MPFDHNNPLSVSLPYNFPNPQDYPTEVMAARFSAWRIVIKDLVIYLKECASVQEEIVRQQMRLQQAVGTPSAPGTNPTSGSHNTISSRNEELNAINKFFLPIGNGSVQDIPGILTRYHQQNVSNASKALKEINNVIVPKLEELRKDLQVKIKEIKNLQNDFKTNLGKEIAETKHLLTQYQQAIELSNKLDDGSSQHHHSHSEGGSEHGRHDPYLIKIKLDRQLKRQLTEENYLYQAYANLQNAGGNLESIVVLEIQNYMSQFLNLLSAANSPLVEVLLPGLNDGFLAKESTFEWNSFISRNLPSPTIGTAIGNSASAIKSGTFIDTSFPCRKLADLNIPNFDSNLNAPVREGMLERRSKYLKSYSSGWYVLTCNYLHEFKTADRKKDQQPAMSLPLDLCTVTEHSKDDGKSGGVYKFILSSKSANGLMHRTHNWVFRTDTYKNMINWYDDIKALTSLPTPASRARFLSKKKGFVNRNVNITSSTGLSRQTSILSNGTAKKSLKSTATVDSPSNQYSSGYLSSQRERPSSRATSVLNTNRLSSTFSQKNNQSPRLANMINSDGTIITPVDTYDETYKPDQHEDDEQKQSEQQQQPQAQDPNQPHIAVQPQVSTPQQSVNYKGIQYLTPQANYPYYLPTQPNQPQQVYDPVQQQYFTLTPSMPVHGPGHPQPQYFPTSPQPANHSQFVSVPSQPQPPRSPVLPGQSFDINTTNHFPQYAGGPQYAESLPYHTNLQPVVTSTEKLSLDDESRNVTREENAEDVRDEVSTLQTNEDTPLNVSKTNEEKKE